MMDCFTRFHSYGCKVNLSCLIPILLAFSLVQDQGFCPSHLFPRFPVRPHPLPAHPYLHATSAFSPTLQFFLRSVQLDTADVRFRQLGDTALCCRLGCAAIETVRQVMFLSNALPSLAFRGLICRA